MAEEAIVLPCKVELEEQAQEISGETDHSDAYPTRDFLSIVVPAFNEGDKIRSNLEECLREMNDISMPFEIVVVNDGSVDNTRQQIYLASRDHPEIVPVSYAINKGKGNALIVGSKKASGNIVVFMDADLEIHPRQIKRFIREMNRTNADVIIGSKRHPDSKVDYPLKRRLLSWGYHLIIKVMFNLHVTDTQPGFKLFKKEVLDRELTKTLTKKYAFDLELLVNISKDGYKIVEAPIELKFSRKFGGRIGFKTIKSIMQETLGIFYRLHISKAYDDVVPPTNAQKVKGELTLK